MQKQNGFTLIELVVVIIILGILAVTAAPKFINLQSDARASTLQGMKGALQGANSLVFSKAAIAGEEKKGSADGATLGSVNIGTGTLATTNYGYLISTVAQLKNALDINISPSVSTEAGYDANAEWFLIKGTNGASLAKIYQLGSPTASDVTKKCWVEYTPATSSSVSPVYKVVSDDC
ncbi:MSHA biogenesis protein MshA [Shewanella sp. Choline-02u-19]|uniref:type II secretion system protein n=1 Tax=unclassified Shewanella TaxID=196818 RepID=UPI000C31D792|nr:MULTISPECIES: prepilin-type N-terminal cleavage/methylation domain-containing protein [unclassified Shewanella]PKH58833.1 MSHA biogenesis protein MshA [Shewanella sp. Bg11-22]PKI29020.1 MSHA biogenesis protein MshA [Shewanella sp. Choline-02u-19]